MRFYTFLLAVFLTAGLSAQTVYVNIDNPAPGDGSSWATAFTNLNDALLGAPAGAEVWIAAGTYVTPDTASFFIDKELTVRGGFNGTETSADAADPDTNPTILSGDVLGNDGDMGYDSLLYLDNNRVLFVTDTAETSAYTVTLDGFSIVHGGVATEIGDLNADGGAGLRTFAKLNASRLKFNSNFSAVGSAILVRFRSTDGTIFDDIEVSGNFAGGQRNIYVRENVGVEFINSTFTGEGASFANSGMVRGFNTLSTAFRNCSFSDIGSAIGGGGLALAFCADFIVDACTFTNITTGADGGAIYALFSSLSVDKSDFEECEAIGDAGGIFIITNEEDVTETFNLSNSTFNLCSGNTFGGAVSVITFATATITTTIDNTAFTECTSRVNGQGAACYIQAVTSPVTLTNSVVRECTARGGAFTFNSQGTLTVRNTQFLDNGNSSDVGRGALVGLMAPGQPVIIDSCLFESNQTTSVSGYFSAGAALLLAGGNSVPTPLTLTNTQFINNAAGGESSGGAIYLSSSFDANIDNCSFNGNSSGGSGGAINSISFESSRDTSAMGEITITFQPFTGKITNSRFLNNFANGQGGAINTNRMAFDLTNCLFVNNQLGAEGGSGGAIIFNGLAQFIDPMDPMADLGLLGDLALTSTMINNTFVNNRKGEADGAAGNDVALFQEGSSAGLNGGSIAVTLLNNAFLQSEQGASIEIEAGRNVLTITPVGMITATSLGGNFYNNESDPDLALIGANDFVDLTIDDANGITELFVDIFDDAGEGVDAQLRIPATPEDNPLINSAIVSDLVPETDLAGNPRGDAPDIGAYEADQGAVSTSEPLADSGLDIAFFPNPTKDVLNVRNDEAGIDRFTVIVSDQSGRVLKARQFNGANNSLDFTNVPAGVYNLQVVVKGRIYGQLIVKQ